MDNPGITLCMVVRNAEERLTDLLPRVAPLVDEIVVVDQQSTDKTVKILEKHGARVISTTPKGFADPDRDYCYSLATQDWVLAMDADETLNAELTANIREMVKDRTIDCYWFLFENTINGVDISHLLGPYPHPRLWRRLLPDGTPNIRWPSKAHTLPAIASPRVCYVEKGRFIHARTMDEVRRSHEARAKVVDPKALADEKKFLAEVEKAIQNASLAGNVADAKPHELDETPRPVGKRP